MTYFCFLIGVYILDLVRYSHLINYCHVKNADRALKWPNENEYDNQVLKWETGAWGENPADFGRK